MDFRSLVKDYIPPALFRFLQSLRSTSVHFSGNYHSWSDASADCSGYDTQHILDKVLSSTLKVRNGEAAFERDSVLFEEIEYAWPILSGLMWAAAKDNGKLNVLDFGGALGSSFFQNKKFLDTLPSVCWSIVEQAHYVQAGQQHLQNDTLKFYLTIEDSLRSNRPNVVLLSSVLQYLESPYCLLEKLQSCRATTLIIDRTPFSSFEKDRIVIQHVPSNIYSASYPMRIFAWESFLSMITTNWEVIATNVSQEGICQTKEGIHMRFNGLILAAKNV